MILGLPAQIWYGAILGAILTVIVGFIHFLLKTFWRRIKESRPVRKLLGGVANSSDECRIFVTDLFPQNAPEFIAIDRITPGSYRIGIVPNIPHVWPDVEARAVSYLNYVLGRVGKTKNVSIVRRSEDSGNWNSNIIVIGAQCPRSFAFYQRMQYVAYRMNGTGIYDAITNERIERQDGYGYGIILKCRNPFKTDGNGVAFLVGGFGVLGTIAAAYYLKEHFSDLGRYFGRRFFGILVRAPIDVGEEAVERMQQYDIRFTANGVPQTRGKNRWVRHVASA